MQGIEPQSHASKAHMLTVTPHPHDEISAEGIEPPSPGLQPSALTIVLRRELVNAHYRNRTDIRGSSAPRSPIELSERLNINIQL